MTKFSETILARLKLINDSDKDQRQVLIDDFKQQFPNDLDWLEMLSENKQNHVSSQPENFPNIDNYSLLKMLGAGANGQVFLAKKIGQERQVAIKIPMHFLSEEQMQRFKHEVQLLSRLSHPNIAKIIETGSVTQTGQWFMAMEYVDGSTILNYCQSNQLNSTQIVELFSQVLDAVQYAHNRGIVHRDLKPENILVARDGSVKLLDFGIAFATENSTQQLTQLTKTGEIVGTLAYMSPEQVSGQDGIDTRTDVYSLGVVLYQLLSHCLPHKIDANQIFSAISQIIEDLPTKLSSQNSSIDDDLVTIVHHAIEKEPNNRYQSPRDFKDDLNNWLQGNPITVKHNTFWYSLKYFSKKHKALVMGSVLAILGLIIGLIFAVSFAFKEQQAREIAEANAKTSKKTVEFINQLFSSADPENVFGEKLTLLQVIDNADSTLKTELRGEPVVEANIRNTIANVYSSIGNYKKAQTQIDISKKLLQAIDNPELKHELQYQLVMNQSNVSLYENKYKENAVFLQKQINSDEFSTKEKNTMRIEMANSLMSDGKVEKAENIIDNAIKRIESQGNNESELLYAMVSKAMILDKMGKFKQSKQLYEKVKQRRIETLGIKHPKTLTLLNNLAAVERNLGNVDEAIKILKQIIRIKTEVLGANHLSTLISKSNVLVIMIEQGKLKEADTYSLALQKSLTQSLGPLHARTLEVGNMRAYLLEDLGRLEEAEKLYKKTIAQYVKIGTVSGTGLALLQNNLAMLLMKQEKYDESNAMFQQLLENIDKTLGKEHIYYAIFIGNYGELLLKMKKFKQAKPLLQRSYEKIAATFGETHQRTLKAKKRLEQLPKNE